MVERINGLFLSKYSFVVKCLNNFLELKYLLFDKDIKQLLYSFIVV